MKKIQLRKRLDLLKKILKINNIDRKQFFQKCSSNCINTLCEACYNLLWNNFKFKRSKIKNINKTLSGISNDFQKLSNPKISLKTKRQLLRKTQTGNGVFTILASTIIPALVSLLAKK